RDPTRDHRQGDRAEMSENRSFFKDTLERILADTLDKADIDAAEDRCLPADLYPALIDNGITLALVPEDQGGIGASIGDAAVLMRAAGGAAAPGPLLDTMLGQMLLGRAGFELSDGLVALTFTDGADFPAASETIWNDAHLHDVAWPEA